MKTRIADGCILILVGLFLIVPLALTFLYSVFTEWMDVLPTGFTLQFYKDIFVDGAFINSLLRSMIISVVPVMICRASYLIGSLCNNALFSKIRKICRDPLQYPVCDPRRHFSGRYPVLIFGKTGVFVQPDLSFSGGLLRYHFAICFQRFKKYDCCIKCAMCDRSSTNAGMWKITGFFYRDHTADEAWYPVYDDVGIYDAVC